MLIKKTWNGASCGLAAFTVQFILTHATVKIHQPTECTVNSRGFCPSVSRGQSLLQGTHRAGAEVLLRSGAAKLAGAFRKQFGLGLGPELSSTHSNTRDLDVPFPFGDAAALAQRHLLQMADNILTAEDGHVLHRERARRGRRRKGDLLRHYAEQTPPVMLILPPEAYAFAPQDEETLGPELVIESEGMRPFSDISLGGSRMGPMGPPMLSMSSVGGESPLEPFLAMAEKPESHHVTMMSFPLPVDPIEDVSAAAAHMAGELQGLEDRLGADGVDAVIDKMYRDLKRKYKHRIPKAKDISGEPEANQTTELEVDVNKTENAEPGIVLVADDDMRVNKTADDPPANSSLVDHSDNATTSNQNVSSQANNASGVSITITSADSTQTVGNLSELNVSAIFDKGLKEMRDVLENSVQNASSIPNIEFPDDFGNAWPAGGFESSASASSSQVTSTQTVYKDGKVITTSKHCENGKCTETTQTVDAPTATPSLLLAGQREKPRSVVY